MWARLTAATTATCMSAIGGLAPAFSCNYWTLASSASPPAGETLGSTLSASHAILQPTDMAGLGLLMIAGILVMIGHYRRRAAGPYPAPAGSGV